jgi:hypothetical protein
MQNRLLFIGKKRDITGPKPAYRKRSYKKRKKKKIFHTPIVVHIWQQPNTLLSKNWFLQPNH